METITKNKKALFNYNIEKTIETGIVLTGCEIKSIRNGNVNLKDSYAQFKGHELFIYNMYIAPYENGSFSNEDPKRPKKLLLHKSELLKLQIEQKTQRIVLVPISIYFKNKNVKVELGIARPKKLYDKRQAKAKQDSMREIQRNLKTTNR